MNFPVMLYVRGNDVSVQEARHDENKDLRCGQNTQNKGNRDTVVQLNFEIIKLYIITIINKILLILKSD